MDYFQYTADGGTVYRMLVDPGVASGLGFLPATGTEPLIPDTISPRYGVFKTLVQGTKCTNAFPFPTLNKMITAFDSTFYVNETAFQLNRYVGESTDLNPFAANGPQGAPGQPGVKGDTGLKGDKGDTGLKGDKGDTGSPGTPGLKGDKGDTGLKGDKGDTGLKGDKGDTGPAGVVSSQSAALASDLTMTAAATPYQAVYLTPVPIGVYAFLATVEFQAGAANADLEAWVNESGAANAVGAQIRIPTSGNNGTLCFTGILTITASTGVGLNVQSSVANSIVRKSYGNKYVRGTSLVLLKVA